MKEDSIKIVISDDFTDSPGARYRTDGAFSGQEFLEDILKPKFNRALENKCKLIIDLDNTWGYASSFISGSFGELSKEFGTDNCLKHLEFKSDDDDLLILEITEEIKDPTQSKSDKE